MTSSSNCSRTKCAQRTLLLLLLMLLLVMLVMMI
jgi:hypothetical protein